MAGIHAGDPERLSMRATFPRFVDLERKHRSLIRGMWAARPRGPSSSASAFYSLEGGLAELVDAMGRRLPAAPLFGVAATAVARDARGFVVALADGGLVQAPAVVLAVPAPAAASVVSGLLPDAVPLLQSVPFASTATKNGNALRPAAFAAVYFALSASTGAGQPTRANQVEGG